MRILIILLFAILFGCNQRPSESSTSKQNNDEFAQFVSMLPQLSLPYEVYCEKCCGHPDLDYESDLIKKYKPEGSSPVGLIFKDEKHVAILVTYAGDMLIPAVVVFDFNGNKIDEKNFMTGWCDRDYDFKQSQYFKINVDHTLNETDTAYYFSINTETDEIIDTTKIEISNKNFYISTN